MGVFLDFFLQKKHLILLIQYLGTQLETRGGGGGIEDSCLDCVVLQSDRRKLTTSICEIEIRALMRR